MLELVATTKFNKNLILSKKQGKDLDKLEYVINILQSGKKLNEKFKDHKLTGVYEGVRECHIQPDWLLIYEIKKELRLLRLIRLGSHAKLFNK